MAAFPNLLKKSSCETSVPAVGSTQPLVGCIPWCQEKGTLLSEGKSCHLVCGQTDEEEDSCFRSKLIIFVKVPSACRVWPLSFSENKADVLF